MKPFRIDGNQTKAGAAQWKTAFIEIVRPTFNFKHCETKNTATTTTKQPSTKYGHRSRLAHNSNFHPWFSGWVPNCKCVTPEFFVAWNPPVVSLIGFYLKRATMAWYECLSLAETILENKRFLCQWCDSLLVGEHDFCGVSPGHTTGEQGEGRGEMAPG